MKHLNCNSKLVDGTCYSCGYTDFSYTPVSFIDMPNPTVKQKQKKVYIIKGTLRERIFARDDYKCLKCGSKENLTHDHVKPLSKGGKNTLENGQTLCFTCNVNKADSEIDYRLLSK